MDIHYQIPRLALLWILAALLLVILPSMLRLPPWILMLTLGCMGWRLLIFKGRANYPGKLVKMLIVFTALPLTLFQFRTQGVGLDAAVCLLILGVVFKLLEMQYKRDIIIVIVLAYVLTMIGFIYSQTIPSGLHAVLAVAVITGTLISLSRDNARNNVRQNSRLAFQLVLQSIPLTLVLFVLVPRIAPLWTMPLPVPSNTTGVTDEMTPGDISNLSRSGELAFRVSFEGEAPSHDQLYWRGLVLDNFDGQTWRRGGRGLLDYGMISRYPSEFRGVPLGEPIAYDVILEPTQQTWVYGMQLAEVAAGDIVQDRNYSLHTQTPITQRLRYQLQSWSDYRTDLDLPGVLRARALQLPEEDLNTRSLALAQALRAAATDNRDYVTRVMQHFREQPFYYTLNPPLLGEARIDDFLFETREGFCEHYAGSFVYLMRAAGIPARVVVGYQGGESNPFENYTMVYQYNAHAWAEVWFEGEGWLRFDPTGAVAPERISQGVEAVFANQPGFMEDSGFSMMRFRDTQWLNSLRLRMDAVDYAWNRWVVSYDEDMQLAFLEDIFGERARSSLLAALGFSTALIFAIAAFFLLRGGRSQPRDPATRGFLALSADLAAVGLPRQRGEGPLDYCVRVGVARPELAAGMQKVTQLYVQLCYAGAGSDELRQEFRLALQTLRLRVLSRARRAGLVALSTFSR
ncbi:MAG: DUF3488 and transglutaminase-like domain-containing protein [Pseudomonadota bacterium]